MSINCETCAGHAVYRPQPAGAAAAGRRGRRAAAGRRADGGRVGRGLHAGHRAARASGPALAWSVNVPHWRYACLHYASIPQNQQRPTTSILKTSGTNESKQYMPMYWPNENHALTTVVYAYAPVCIQQALFSLFSYLSLATRME